MGWSVLILSNASYLQGLMEKYDGDISGIGNPTWGQAITIDYHKQLLEFPVDEPPNPLPKSIGGENYWFSESNWENI
jgi:hypothetical protein